LVLPLARAAALVEVPADVHVRIDAARHERAVTEVEVGARRMLVDADDLRAVDDHRGVAVKPPASVDDARRLDDDGVRVRRCRGEHHEEYGSQSVKKLPVDGSGNGQLAMPETSMRRILLAALLAAS